MPKPQISVIILTLNEELNLGPCLASCQPLTCDLFVVDSGSVDRTEEIARAAGAAFVYHPFDTQAGQLNWALANLPLTGEWILRLDADERLTQELGSELNVRLTRLDEDVTGLFIKRRVYFMGRWIRHGGYYPTWLMRVWRRGAAQCESRVMDEHMVLLTGKPDFLQCDIEEHNRKQLSLWIERQNGYSTREVMALLHKEVGHKVQPSLFGTPEARRRWLKYYAYLPFPPLIRPFLYFFWRYFFRLGFLDGKQGLIFHFLQGCWYRFLVDAKLYEFNISESDKA
jgi:glycosyltransferase involved in cell wall biosynthesis